MTARQGTNVLANDLKGLVKAYAQQIGFDLVAVADAKPFDETEAVALKRVHQGLMDGLPWYTQERVRRGCRPQDLLPGAKSIISVGVSYNLSDDADNAKPLWSHGKVARYAWGDDYHVVLKDRMRAFVDGLSQRIGRPISAKWYVDDGPMLDRAVAQRAGIGWFGKNTNILTTSHGSWVFLGQVITDLEITPDAPLKKTCGECVRCIGACPTGAIIAPYVIDNSLCISYLTIENRGSIPHHLRPQMLDWVFGCDICQEVCPVNVKAMYSQEQAFQKRRFTVLELVELLEMTGEQFNQRFSKSPIKRAKLVGLQRNACVALGNIGDRAAVPALVLALKRGDPLVRGHSAWSLGRIGGDHAIFALQQALDVEADPEVISEIEVALGKRLIEE